MSRVSTSLVRHHKAASLALRGRVQSTSTLTSTSTPIFVSAPAFKRGTHIQQQTSRFATIADFRDLPTMAQNEFYQYSIISALMDGVASHGTPISKVLENGDHGIGTFAKMNGEMIILDGQVYQMNADGSIVQVNSPSTTTTPFACVTRFKPTARSSASLKDSDLKTEINRVLDGHFPNARNHILAFRMDGRFSKVRVRTAGGQVKPGESLMAVVERQAMHTYENVRGTMIGFRSPEWVTGLNVVDHHLHFISDDRQHGGHVLGLETDGDVDVQVSLLSKFHMDVPTDHEFNEAGLVVNPEDIAACES